MAVKVLITRLLKPGALVDAALALSQLRGQAMVQPGYISGETLVSRDEPNKLVVVSTWDSFEDWRRWRDNPLRAAGEGRLENYLASPVGYEVFNMGVRPES